MTPRPSIESRTIEELRNEGYAILIWAPDELHHASASTVEARSIGAGWDIIDTLRECDCDVTEPCTVAEFYLGEKHK